MAKIVDHSLLPDFLIVGAMKGGTTSLAYYLREHPEIFMPSGEVHFFDEDRHWRRGTEWYARLFSEANTEQKIGEKTPAYSFEPNLRPTIPERIVSLLPDVKLLWCLRNPVERAYSHYWHNVTQGRERRSFERALEREERSAVPGILAYRGRGIYVDQVRSFLRVFPLKQMHFIISERFFADTRQTMREVYQFLGVDSTFEGTRTGTIKGDRKQIARLLFVPRLIYPLFWAGKVLERRKLVQLARKLHRLNTRFFSRPRPEMGPDTRRKLEDFYRPHNRELAELLGVDLAHWGWSL